MHIFCGSWHLNFTIYFKFYYSNSTNGEKLKKTNRCYKRLGELSSRVFRWMQPAALCSLPAGQFEAAGAGPARFNNSNERLDSAIEKLSLCDPCMSADGYPTLRHPKYRQISNSRWFANSNCASDQSRGPDMKSECLVANCIPLNFCPNLTSKCSLNQNLGIEFKARFTPWFSSTT